MVLKQGNVVETVIEKFTIAHWKYLLCCVMENSSTSTRLLESFKSVENENNQTTALIFVILFFILFALCLLFICFEGEGNLFVQTYVRLVYMMIVLLYYY